MLFLLIYLLSVPFCLVVIFAEMLYDIRFYGATFRFSTVIGNIVASIIPVINLMFPICIIGSFVTDAVFKSQTIVEIENKISELIKGKS